MLLTMMMMMLPTIMIIMQQLIQFAPITQLKLVASSAVAYGRS
jgi:hypothetical protein